jgi:endo-1,4-beta-xylanase
MTMTSFALFCMFTMAFALQGVAADDATDAAIRKCRMGTIVVHARPGATVKVTQLSHEFWFGTAISTGMFSDRADPAVREQYLRILKDNFNSAVHENALKWPSIERRAGQVSYDSADRILAWCEANGIRMRGHCIFWAVDQNVQNWVKQLDDADLRATLERRAKEVTGRYAGRILEYDVNNEMLHGHYYEGRLGADIRVQMFKWAHEGDPKARLFVNDYNILTGGDAVAYERQIEGLIAAGAPVGGIGCQGHFGGQIDMTKVKQSLDRLSRFGLPIRITEFDIDTDNEQEKARLLGEFYTTCFAEPAVDGIVMWGFYEGAHWRPKAALWKRDFTPTPAAQVYRDLVFNKWWTRFEGKADPNGVCRAPAFFGRHKVEADGKSVEVELRKAAGTAEASP